MQKKAVRKGQVFRKRAHFSGSAGATKALVPRGGQLNMSPSGIYSDMAPHFFRRALPDVTIFCSSAGVVSLLEPNNVAPNYVSVGNLTADVGALNVSQFAVTVTPFLAALPSVSAFTALYSRFQIRKFEMNVANCNGISNTNIGCVIPQVTVVEDYTDAGLLASQQAADSFQSNRKFSLNDSSSFDLACVPKPSTVMFISGVSSGYSSSAASNKPQWMDSATSSSVPHYAFKLWFRNFFTGANNGGNLIRLSPVLYFACREPQ
jgi:hypothetical protein